MTREGLRRLVHASGVGLVLLYVGADILDLGLTWLHFQFLVWAVTIVGLSLEFLRLQVGLDWWIYEHLTREYEEEQLAGYALYLLGMAIAVLAFDPPIALAVMTILAIADPISGFVSESSLRTVKRPRALAVMFVVSTGLAVVFTPLSVSIAIATGTTIADGIKVRVRGIVLDDNLTIPIYGGICGFVASTIIIG